MCFSRMMQPIEAVTLMTCLHLDGESIFILMVDNCAIEAISTDAFFSMAVIKNFMFILIFVGKQGRYH